MLFTTTALSIGNPLPGVYPEQYFIDYVESGFGGAH